MHVLILNWRDPRNPSAGGAEVLTFEIARRLVRDGDRVTWMAAGFHGSPPTDTLDGVSIVRLGRWYSVHVLAFIRYLTRYRAVDRIIDEVHWFPFFAGWYAPGKTILLACEVAGPLFDALLPRGFATIGRILEQLYLRSYRHIPVLAISPSTRRDFLSAGFPSQRVKVLRMGITVPVTEPKIAKERELTMVFVGRWNKLKGMPDAVRALSIIQQSVSGARLWLIGKGSDQEVMEIARRYGIDHPDRSIRCYGPVSEKEKFELLARAHVLIHPSVSEGFGLTVPEAGFVGTPTVAYDTRGLRDLIEHNRTGILTSTQSPEDMAREIIALWMDRPRYDTICRHVRPWAKQFDWEQTYRDFRSSIIAS